MTIDLPDSLIAGIKEYHRLLEIPSDKFPGHRPIALLNMAAYIGEVTSGLYRATNSKEESNEEDV